MIPFNQPLNLGTEADAVARVLASGALAGGGPMTRACEAWCHQQAGAVAGHGALMTPSCTQALELAALLADIVPGDEVIMPAYTFVSTANAFVLRGATPVFVDIRPDTCNIDETLIEAAITPRTRAIVPVHYAGIACAMDEIMALAARYQLLVIEDAAQAVMARYNGKPLGSIGDYGAYSFHATKNYTSGGEGGLLMINRPGMLAQAEILREKGTNRSAFARGELARYEWLDRGSSYLPSDMQAACLLTQLEQAARVNDHRRALWYAYHEALAPLAEEGRVTLPAVPQGAYHNGHLFYLRLADSAQRQRVIAHLAGQGITASTHYVPLHTSPGGQRFARFHGEDRYTTRVSETLLRLPLFYGLSADQQAQVIRALFAIL